MYLWPCAQKIDNKAFKCTAIHWKVVCYVGVFHLLQLLDSNHDPHIALRYFPYRHCLSIHFLHTIHNIKNRCVQGPVIVHTGTLQMWSAILLWKVKWFAVKKTLQKGLLLAVVSFLWGSADLLNCCCVRPHSPINVAVYRQVFRTSVLVLEPFHMELPMWTKLTALLQVIPTVIAYITASLASESLMWLKLNLILTKLLNLSQDVVHNNE